MSGIKISVIIVMALLLTASINVVSAVPPVTTGTLSITTTPVSGTISVDGVNKGTGSWSGSVSKGSHTVSFGSVSGYTTPTSQKVNVNTGQTTTVKGVYVVTFVNACQDTKNIRVSCAVDKYGNKWCGYSGQTSVLCSVLKVPPPNSIGNAKPSPSAACWNSAFIQYSDGLSNRAAFCASAVCKTDSTGNQLSQTKITLNAIACVGSGLLAIADPIYSP